MSPSEEIQPRVPRTGRIVALVAGGAALVALNVAALTSGWQRPEIVAPAVALDFAAFAVSFWLAWRQSMRAEDSLRRGSEREHEAARVRQALDVSETRISAIVDSAMDAVITTDAAQRIVVFNRAAEQMFRCAREDALGAPLERFMPQRFRGTHRLHIEKFGRTGVTNRRMGDTTLLWALRADGEEFPIEASISQTGTHDARLYTVILRDITRRKQAEDDLRRSHAELRELSARVLEAREEEKTLIARELHDELGQALTALKMDVAWMRGSLPPAQVALATKIDSMDQMLDATVASVRRISSDLRPLMLDDLGLYDAADWLVKDFAQRSGIQCEFEALEARELDSVALPVATALYRILQESLTNVSRHARAKRVRVELRATGTEVTLSVDDDGCGISAADRGKIRSIGLKGMHERAHYLDGRTEIGAGPLGGTRVATRIPRMRLERGVQE